MFWSDNAEKNDVQSVLSALYMCVEVFKIIKQKGLTMCIFPNVTISDKDEQSLLVLIIIE
jgi:hypothetical protein